MAESKSESQNRGDPAAQKAAEEQKASSAAPAEEQRARASQSVTDGASTKDQTDERGLTAEEAKQFGDLQAKVAKADAEKLAAGETMKLRVEGQHSHMTYGGVTITSEGTEVPVSMYGPLASAAADAGVELTHVTEE